jgi:hypothetical protein
MIVRDQRISPRNLLDWPDFSGSWPIQTLFVPRAAPTIFACCSLATLKGLEGHAQAR